VDATTHRVYWLRMTFLNDVLVHLDIKFEGSNNMFIYETSSISESGEKIVMQNCEMLVCIEASFEDVIKINGFFVILEETVKDSILIEEFTY